MNQSGQLYGELHIGNVQSLTAKFVYSTYNVRGQEYYNAILPTTFLCLDQIASQWEI